MPNIPSSEIKGQSEGKVPATNPRSGDGVSRHELALRYTGIASWVWDLSTGVVECDPAFYELFDLPADSLVTSDVAFGSIHPDDVALVQAALEACFEDSSEIYDCRFRVKAKGDQWRWLRGKGQVIERGDDGGVLKVVGINFDLTEQMKWEERVSAVAGEMRHRVKNSLAMVNALAAATAREAADMQSFMQKFRGRIEAIAAAQRIAADTSDDISMTVKSAIDGGLAPFISSQTWSERIDTKDVSDAPISSSIAQALTLAIYEFGTNSVKYGALSETVGTVHIEDVTTEGDSGFGIRWRETVEGTQPDFDTTGFGSSLVDRLLSAEGGTVHRSNSGHTLTIEMLFPHTG